MLSQTIDTSKVDAYGMTISEGGGDRRGIITANRVDRSVNHTSRYLEEHLGMFPSIEEVLSLRRPADISSGQCGDQNVVFVMQSQTISIHNLGDQYRYFKPNHYAFLTLTMWICAKPKLHTSTRLWQWSNRKFNLIKHIVATFSL